MNVERRGKGEMIFLLSLKAALQWLKHCRSGIGPSEQIFTSTAAQEGVILNILNNLLLLIAAGNYLLCLEC